jgi:hypothetical protein
MDVIVFSKNRPPQLDALIQTVDKFAPFFRLHVIYTYDAEPFGEGYQIVIKKYPHVAFYKEMSFRQNVMRVFEKITGEHMGFLCDDDLFFGKWTMPTPLPDDVLCFSIRLGKNTTHCLNFNKEQAYNGEISGDYLVWCWMEGLWDFGYPMSIDGHVFRVSDISKLLENIEFNNPIEFEDSLTKSLLASPIRSERPKMMASLQSALVGVPDNKVNFNFPFPNAGGSPEKLNQAFLEGKCIRPFSMDFNHIKGVHQIIPFVVY